MASLKAWDVVAPRCVTFGGYFGKACGYTTADIFVCDAVGNRRKCALASSKFIENIQGLFAIRVDVVTLNHVL